MKFFVISIVTEHYITVSNSVEFAISLRFRFLWMSQLYIILNWEGKQDYFSYLLQQLPFEKWNVRTADSGVPRNAKKADDQKVRSKRLV